MLRIRSRGRDQHERHISGRPLGRLGHAPVAAVAGHVPQAVHPLLRRPGLELSRRHAEAAAGRGGVRHADRRLQQRSPLPGQGGDRAGRRRATAPSCWSRGAQYGASGRRCRPAGRARGPGRHPGGDAVRPCHQGRAGFVAAVQRAAEVAATGKLVLFGIAPDPPHTGYGYIRRGAPWRASTAPMPSKPSRRSRTGQTADGLSRSRHATPGTAASSCFGARAFLDELGPPRARHPGRGPRQALAGAKRGPGLPAARRRSLCARRPASRSTMP